MFPYGDEEKFKEHKFYKSIEEVNIGAFPMLPGSTKLITKQLQKIIDQSSLEARSDRVVIDEYDEYGKFKHKNIMVVNVYDEKHFKSYRENLFYHIPIEKLSTIKSSVEYLAFYQPKVNFKEDAGIRYYGKIKSYKEYTREECREIATSRGSEKNVYLRIDLEWIKKIRKVVPIQFGTRLVSYTTMYLLKHSENTQELQIGSSLEFEVYKILKKVAKNKKVDIKKKSNSKFKIEKKELMDEYNVGKIIIKIIDSAKIKVDDKKISLANLEVELNKLL